MMQHFEQVMPELPASSFDVMIGDMYCNMTSELISGVSSAKCYSPFCVVTVGNVWYSLF